MSRLACIGLTSLQGRAHAAKTGEQWLIRRRRLQEASDRLRDSDADQTHPHGTAARPRV
jgi:hypothetical protein